MGRIRRLPADRAGVGFRAGRPRSGRARAGPRLLVLANGGGRPGSIIPVGEGDFPRPYDCRDARRRARRAPMPLRRCPTARPAGSTWSALAAEGLVLLRNQGTADRPSFGPREPLGLPADLGLGALPGRPDGRGGLGRRRPGQPAGRDRRPGGLLARRRDLADRAGRSASTRRGAIPATTGAGLWRGRAPEGRIRWLKNVGEPGASPVRAPARARPRRRPARPGPAPGPAGGLVGRRRQPGIAGRRRAGAGQDPPELRRPAPAGADGAPDPQGGRGTLLLPEDRTEPGRRRPRRRPPRRAGLRDGRRPGLRDPVDLARRGLGAPDAAPGARPALARRPFGRRRRRPRRRRRARPGLRRRPRPPLLGQGSGPRGRAPLRPADPDRGRRRPVPARPRPRRPARGADRPEARATPARPWPTGPATVGSTCSSAGPGARSCSSATTAPPNQPRFGPPVALRCEGAPLILPPRVRPAVADWQGTAAGGPAGPRPPGIPLRLPRPTTRRSVGAPIPLVDRLGRVIRLDGGFGLGGRCSLWAGPWTAPGKVDLLVGLPADAPGSSCPRLTGRAARRAGRMVDRPAPGEPRAARPRPPAVSPGRRPAAGRRRRRVQPLGRRRRRGRRARPAGRVGRRARPCDPPGSAPLVTTRGAVEPVY